MEWPESYLSLLQAAEREGVHYQTVRPAIAGGALKAIKVGTGIGIRLSELDQWQPKYKHAPRRQRSNVRVAVQALSSTRRHAGRRQ